MAKLELTLHSKKGETHYKEDHVPGQKLLDYWNLTVALEENTEQLSLSELFLKRVEFAASLFTHEDVTTEAILTGVKAWELIDVVNNIINTAMGVETDDPKPSDLVLEKGETVS